MKISIQFTADLVLENVELADNVAKEIIAHFEKNGTLTEEHLDLLMNDQSADLYVEEVLEIGDVCEYSEESLDDNASDN
jgi:hypothetical protein